MAAETGEPIVKATLLEEGTLLRLVLNKPKGNVLTLEMMKALSEALTTHIGNPHLRMVFIRGAGNHFSFGASVEEHQKEQAPSMLAGFHAMIRQVAPTDATVLIQGESGTGKELVARAIHERSLRNQGPFVVINCSAYPSTLLESELFGHEKGAFTGAVRRKIGRFEQAQGGTVFLDEIGEIPPPSQIKLLRVLQSQKFERLGGESTVHVDVRILAATNRNLIDEVRAGRFREDLFYRLNVIPIHLPPLRQRGNDIPTLAHHFLKRFAAEQAKPVERFSSEAMRLMMAYAWPGNVRELENSVEHAVALAKEHQVEVKDLPASLAETPLTEVNATLTVTASEEKLIRETLEACNWNKAEAARQLGISRSTLYEKIKRLQIVGPTLH
jgi:two-component system response regulator HydG